MPRPGNRPPRGLPARARAAGDGHARRRRAGACAALGAAFALAWLCALAPARAAEPAATIAAASDLKFALEALAARFEHDSGQRLRLVFGSSGNFYAQILQGAPFDVYLSADEAFVLRLAAAGRTRDRGRLYAYGRIGVMVAKDSPLAADGTLSDLAAALGDGRLRRFALANPAHAPYGMRAREALRHAGLWAPLEPHLVFGENIAQAAQFVVSGAAEGGIIAYSLARAPALAARSEFALIPESWHRRLAQRMVVLADARPAGHAFYAYLATPPARDILQRFGFALPGE